MNLLIFFLIFRLSAVLLISLFSLATFTKAITLRCNYYSSEEYGATCEVNQVKINNENVNERLTIENPQYLKQVQYLLFTDSLLEGLPTYLFMAFPQVSRLGFDNSVVDINDNNDFFKYAGNVKQLLITNSDVLRITPNTFKYLNDLEELVLNFNSISKLKSNVFVYNPKLRRIHMTDNKVDSIEETFFNNLRLEFIDLRDNECTRSFVTNPKRTSSPLYNCFSNFDDDNRYPAPSPQIQNSRPQANNNQGQINERPNQGQTYIRPNQQQNQRPVQTPNQGQTYERPNQQQSQQPLQSTNQGQTNERPYQGQINERPNQQQNQRPLQSPNQGQINERPIQQQSQRPIQSTSQGGIGQSLSSPTNQVNNQNQQQAYPANYQSQTTTRKPPTQNSQEYSNQNAQYSNQGSVVRPRPNNQGQGNFQNQPQTNQGAAHQVSNKRPQTQPPQVNSNQDTQAQYYNQGNIGQQNQQPAVGTTDKLNQNVQLQKPVKIHESAIIIPAKPIPQNSGNNKDAIVFPSRAPQSYQIQAQYQQLPNTPKQTTNRKNPNVDSTRNQQTIQQSLVQSQNSFSNGQQAQYQISSSHISQNRNSISTQQQDPQNVLLVRQHVFPEPPADAVIHFQKEFSNHYQQNSQALAAQATAFSQYDGHANHKSLTRNAFVSTPGPIFHPTFNVFAPQSYSG